MLSEGYQKLLAEQGLTPGIKSAAQYLPDTAIAKAQAEALANSKFTPTSPNWAEVEAAQIIPDALVKIAQGGDVAAIAAELDTPDRGDPQQVAPLEGSRPGGPAAPRPGSGGHPCLPVPGDRSLLQPQPQRTCSETAHTPETEPIRHRKPTSVREPRRRPVSPTASGARRREARGAWTLLGPSLIILGVMVGYPAVLMVIQSFTDYTVKNKVLGHAAELHLVRELHRPVHRSRTSPPC